METDLGSLTWSSPDHAILLNPRWPADDLRVLTTSAERVLRDHAREPSFVLSSSGTSAGTWREIKLILLSKRAVLAGAKAVSTRFAFTSRDRLGDLLPGFHVGGLSVSARAFVSGAAHVDLRARDWGPEDFHRLASQANVTIASLVPTQLHDLVEKNLKAWPGLRIVFLGGAILSPTLESRARALGWPVVATYGMTETSAMIAVRDDADPSKGFEALPGVTLSLTAENLIHVFAPSLATGFARLGENGDVAWIPIDPSGYITEDYGRFNGGRLEVLGRGRDHLKINGENVNLNVLRAIMDRLVAGRLRPEDWHLTARPDERHGHVIVLVVRRDIDGLGLKKEFDVQTLPFENIRQVVSVDEIPRTDLGKVREEALRSLIAERGS